MMDLENRSEQRAVGPESDTRPVPLTATGQLILVVIATAIALLAAIGILMVVVDSTATLRRRFDPAAPR